MKTLDSAGEMSTSLSPPQPHQPRQQRQEEQEGAQQPVRIVIPLEQREPIGIELDFSAEAKTGTGVRVSRVDAGLAERMGLRQEDRLAYIGDEDIRDVNYDNVREMLQKLSYPTELMFERKARRNAGGGHFTASRLRKTPHFSHSLLRATTDATPATNRTVTRKRAREGQNRSPSPTDVPCRPASPVHGDLVEQLDFLAAQQSQLPTPTDAPPRPARPMHGDLVEQLDFLAARQLAEEKKTAAAAARVAPAGLKVPAPALRETSAGDGSTSSADHLAVAEPRSSASLATPGLTAVALAMASRSKKAEALLREQHHDRPREHQPRDPRQERRRQQPQGEQEEEEEEREVVVMSVPLPPPQPLLPARSRPRSHSGMSPCGGQRRDSHMGVGSPRGERAEGRGGGGGEGVCREGAGLMASPAMRPTWIEALVCLNLADMAGTDAARAAVLGKEVRDILAKELVVLQRLRKVPACVTLAQYTALRSDSLVSSPGYRTLKSLEQLYLVDHEDELAEIAEESFIEDLVGKSPSAREASPPPRAGDGGGGVDGLPRLQVAPPYASIETVEATPRWVRFIRDSHRVTQDVIRRALASHERAVATTGFHRLLRKQGLLDVEEKRASGKKTERQATEVIAKIRDWEKAARVGEHFALKVSGAVIGRAELMRDALELLMVGIERQRIRLETLATFRLLDEPEAEGWKVLSP